MPPFRDQQSNMMWGRGLFVLLFLILVITAVFLVVAMLSRQRGHFHPHATTSGGDSMTPKPSEALRILDERFARGEIDAEEFTKRRELLRSSSWVTARSTSSRWLTKPSTTSRIELGSQLLRKLDAFVTIHEA